MITYNGVLTLFQEKEEWSEKDKEKVRNYLKTKKEMLCRKPGQHWSFNQYVDAEWMAKQRGVKIE